MTHLVRTGLLTIRASIVRLGNVESVRWAECPQMPGAEDVAVGSVRF